MSNPHAPSPNDRQADVTSIEVMLLEDLVECKEKVREVHHSAMKYIRCSSQSGGVMRSQSCSVRDMVILGAPS